MRGDHGLASRIESAIANVPGVHDCAVRPLTGSVLIRFDPTLTSASRLLKILDRTRQLPATSEGEHPDPKPVGFGMANTSLALAIAGELAIPALLPVCAVLLVGTNLSTFRDAGRQLVRRQLGLPALYTGIVAATVATNQFVVAAGMSWMLRFWQRRYRDQLKSTHAG